MDLESACSLKGYFNSIGCSSVSFFERLGYFDFRFLYLLSSGICYFDKADLIFLFFSNLRLEYPLLNSRLRKNFLYNTREFLFVFCFGFFNDYLTFPVITIGNSLKSINDFFYARIKIFSKLFLNNFVCLSFFTLKDFFYFKPLVLLGAALLNKKDSFSYLLNLNLFFNKFVAIYEN